MTTHNPPTGRSNQSGIGLPGEQIIGLQGSTL